MSLGAPVDYDDTQRMLKDSVAAFVSRESDLVRTRAVRNEAGGFDKTVWQKMAANGWFGLMLPEEVGGAGLGVAEAAVVMEELGRGLVPEPMGFAITLAANVLGRCDTEVTGELLGKIIEGETVPALAWQETRNNYDPAAVSATASAVDGGFSLSGKKVFVPAVDSADGFVVTANGPDGLSLYWIDAKAPGVTVEADRNVDSIRSGTVRFDNAAANCLGTENVADIISAAVDDARLCASAELVGVMSAALDITLDYAKQREQFGRTIGKFQALQHRFVDLWLQSELGRSTVMQAVKTFAETTDPKRRSAEASAAKARCSDAAFLVTRQCIQLHGGIGFTEECNIGMFLKRALLLSAWLGNASENRKNFMKITSKAA